MENPTNPNEIDTYSLRLIGQAVRRVIGKYGFTHDDRDDLERDLLVHLLTRLPRFDPRRAGKERFTRSIVLNRLRNIISNRKSAIRSIAPEDSLNVLVADDEGWAIERIDLVSADAYLQATGQASRPSAELRDLHIDFQRAVDTLPPELQDLCLRLLTQTITEIAREVGVSTATIYYRIRKIRKEFEARGLAEYLR